MGGTPTAIIPTDEVSPPETEITATHIPEATQTPTQTPTVEPTPTITPTPYPPGVTGEPFSDYAILQTYRRFFVEAIGMAPETGSSLQIDAYALSPDGRYLAIGLCNNATNTGCRSAEYNSKPFLVILETGSGKTVANIPVKDITVISLAFTPDSSRLVYAVRPFEVGVWDIEKAALEKVFIKDKNGGYVPYISFSPDGSLLAIINDKKLQIYDFASGERIKEVPNVISLPKFSSDGSRLFALTSSNPLVAILLDTQTWGVAQRIEFPGMQWVDYSMDGKRIISSPSGGSTSIYLWDVDSAEKMAVIGEDYKYLWSAQFTPDGKYVFTGGIKDDQDVGGLTVWDVETLEKIGSLVTMESASSIRFSADGKYFLTSDFYDVWFWGPLSPETASARELVVSFFDALSSGDYEKAAGMYQVRSDEPTLWGVSSGSIAGMMKEACESGVMICLPVKDVLPGGGMTRWGFPSVYVTFAGEDGGLHTDSYGYNQFEVFLDQDAAGNLVVEQVPLNVYP